MDIEVTVKNVYGENKVYPACDTSRKLADLIGTKTFTDRAIQQLRDLGYNIRLLSFPITL